MSLSKYEADNEHRNSGYRNGAKRRPRSRDSPQTPDRLYRKYTGSSGSRSSNSSGSEVDLFDNTSREKTQGRVSPTGYRKNEGTNGSRGETR